MSDDVPRRSGATLTSIDDVARAKAGVLNAQVEDHLGPPQTRTVGGSWQRFVRRYGWRAYALPVLVVITVAALLRGTGGGAGATGDAGATGKSGASAVAPPPAAAPSTVLKRDVGSSPDAGVLQATALPAGQPYDKIGDGTFRVLPGHTKKVGTGQLFRYSIDVENGLTGINLTQFQNLVDTTLDDTRSWSGHGVAVQRVDSGPIDFHVSLTTSFTVRKFCGYTIHAESSCYLSADSIPADVPGPRVNRVFINDSRWVRGASAYVGDLAQYRLYMINHEDGHALGHNHAHQCLPGGLAPAMMQQTFGLRSTATNKFCQANPWPYPTGVRGAPGAEQTDTAANNEYGRGD